MIVIDASTLAKLVLKEKNWKIVRAYLADKPYTVSLALAEVSNAIWKYITLYKKISLSDAENMFRALKELQEHVLFLEPFEIYLDSATKIAIDEKITIYDALYIAQAKRYGEFITSDKKQGNVAKKKGINVKYIE